MAPAEPLLPGDLAPEHSAETTTTRAGHSSSHNPPHTHTVTSPTSPTSNTASRRRSQSVTAAMLAAESDLSLARSLSSGVPADSRPTATTLRGGGSTSGSRAGSMREHLGLGGVARRTLGIALLLVVVFLWTLSNFLASYIFSDGTYNKPFFLVYINTSCFAVSLIPLAARHVAKNGVHASMAAVLAVWRERKSGMLPLKTRDDDGDDPTAAARDLDDDDEDAAAGERLLVDDEGSLETLDSPPRRASDAKLSVAETARLSLEFSMLWFAANYFASACLEYTSVGSVTILTSTSSIWTLLSCALTRVERFTVRKLVGVLASLAGVVLISSVDLSGANDDNRGSFPHKSTAQIAVGDAMAFVSAIIYGVYVTVMKRRVGNEDRVNMPLFFGLVGLFNVLFLWPGFFILHYTGIEPFELPPTGRVWTIIAINSAASFFSDILWAYAMLLTTPLVVTVGLSLNIPLSLIGEMIQYSQYSSWLYWLGAGVVFISFLFVNHESHEEDRDGKEQSASGAERTMV